MYDFGHLRDELNRAIAELEGREAGSRTLAVHVFHVALDFASYLADDRPKPWTVEHGVIVLRLDKNSERNSG